MNVYVPPHLRRQQAAAAAAAASASTNVAAEAPAQAKDAAVTSGQRAGAAAAAPPNPEQTRQREAWDALNRAITAAINRVTLTNVPAIAVDLLRVNIIRGRGLFCKHLMATQHADPQLSHIFAALVAVINKEIPEVGELLVRRLVIMWKRYRRRREWGPCASTGTFLAHLVGQRVQHHLVLLKMLSSLFCVQPAPSDDEMEAATQLLRVSYKFLDILDPDAFEVLLDPIRRLLRASSLSQRSENYLQQLLDEIRAWEPIKLDVPAIPAALDLVEPDEQKTHEVDLDDGDGDLHLALDRFELDPAFYDNEAAYETLARAMIGDELFDLKREEEQHKRVAALAAPSAAAGPDGGDAGDVAAEGNRRRKAKPGKLIGAADSEDEDDDGEAAEDEEVDATDLGEKSGPKAADPFAVYSDRSTEAVRKNIFLAIRSSTSNEEIAHKLLREHSKPETDPIIVKMLLETCCQEKMFNKKYSLTAERLCRTSTRFSKLFVELFQQHYRNAEELTLAKTEMICKFFVPLLCKDAMPWSCMGCMDLQATNADQRIFIQTLWQSLASSFGMQRLKERLRADVELAAALQGLFPRNEPKVVRFAVDLFTAMDLAPLTEDMQRWLDAEQVAAAKRTREFV